MTVHAERRMTDRLLLVVTKAEDERHVARVMDELRAPIFYQLRGQGTAPSELLDLCGLQGTTRILTLSVLPRDRVPHAFEVLGERLHLRRRGGGIAVTMPITGMQSAIHNIMPEHGGEAPSAAQEEAPKMAKTDDAARYSMIFVASNYGYSDEVIDAARRAGARGGTIIKGRRRGDEGVLRFMGMSMQDEQEFCLVIVPQDKRAEVMVEISGACGLKTPAHGVILALPVEDALGLEDGLPRS